MRAPTSLLVRLFATLFVLFGATILSAALAQDAAPAASQSDADANPIDTSITTQPPSHFKRGSKGHASKKSVVANSLGHSGGHHRNLLRANGVGVVRDSIGQVRPTVADLHGTQLRSSEPAGLNGTFRDTGSVKNGGKNTTGTAIHRQGFVPLRVGGVTPHDPRLNAAMNPSIINGRDMVRAGIRASAIGGPAKNNSGTITGTGFRPSNP
jgi:hypothetical protein